ncbi:hypothetical protein [Streptomyces yaizuensis]|uniref:Uncharacterized protein n=1 Tax=Streptomyces yaizuensis TaxID=2989713 RepID=A0ABQ5NT63_9ACTN|nr:hypothetical protein [Streptomyces sp. YSPA8]GLF93442.1 hypothetical protein SYYSPA8_04115 [Streptomyces sp. YSPA8]
MEYQERLLHDVIEESGIRDMPCHCGRTCAHLVEDILHGLQRDPFSLDSRVELDGHVFNGPFMGPMGPALIKVLLAALPWQQGIEPRRTVLNALWLLSDWENEELGAQCAEVLSAGVWTFVDEVASGRDLDSAISSFVILRTLEEDIWVSLLRERYAHHLPARVLEEEDD